MNTKIEDDEHSRKSAAPCICWLLAFIVITCYPLLLSIYCCREEAALSGYMTTLLFSPVVKKQGHANHTRASRIALMQSRLRNSRKQMGSLGNSASVLPVLSNHTANPFAPYLVLYLNESLVDSALEPLRAKLLQLQPRSVSNQSSVSEQKRYDYLLHRYEQLTGQRDFSRPHALVGTLPFPDSDVYYDPVYYYPFQEYRILFSKPFIAPVRTFSHERKPQHPFAEQGIVLYVYGSRETECTYANPYVQKAIEYVTQAKYLSPSVFIALVTNCHLPRILFRHIDILIPIAPTDIVAYQGRSQFTTRMIYNAFPPFQFNLVLDSHTNWCASEDPEEAFSQFRASDVDLAFSTRVVNRWVTSGFAVMYRYNPRSFDYWKRVARFNIHYGIHGDDQYGMRIIATQMRKRKQLRFRWLSNNWFYSTHGVSEHGDFIGSARYYRSSVLVNGRIRFIHTGISGQCEFMNRKDAVNRVRTQFVPGECAFAKRGAPQLVFSQKEMDGLVRPFRSPKFNWTLIDHEDPDGLFWYEDKGFS